MEWADVLINWKCGGEPEKHRWEVEIGDKYEAYFCGGFDSVITVDSENKVWIEDMMNDPENDVWEFNKI